MEDKIKYNYYELIVNGGIPIFIESELDHLTLTMKLDEVSTFIVMNKKLNNKQVSLNKNAINRIEAIASTKVGETIIKINEKVFTI